MKNYFKLNNKKLYSSKTVHLTEIFDSATKRTQLANQYKNKITKRTFIRHFYDRQIEKHWSDLAEDKMVINREREQLRKAIVTGAFVTVPRSYTI